MIVDAQSLPRDQVLSADVCVVGAGPAGITLGRELRGTGAKVLLLESGGLRPAETESPLSGGESVGFPYDRLDGARHRAFGGNSWRWSLDAGGGVRATRLRAMDPLDFERRDWVPFSGWPFGRDRLESFYRRAHRIFRIGPPRYDPEYWEAPPDRVSLPLDGEHVRSTIFQFGRGDLFHTEYQRDLARSSNVTVVVHSTVVRLETDENGRRVVRARAVYLPDAGAGVGTTVRSGDQKAFSVEARLFVLAAGGTENPRLLLASHQGERAGIGNRHDQVGRFFMEHPHHWSGHVVPFDRALFRRLGLYRIHRARGVPVMAKLTLLEETLRRERMLGWCASLHPHDGRWGARSFQRLARAARGRKKVRGSGRHLANVLRQPHDVVASLHRQVLRKLGGSATRPERPPAVLVLNHMTEQAPNPESRVTLSRERDPLGVPRVRVDWRPGPLDVRSLVRAQEILGSALRRSGVGRLRRRLRGRRPPGDLHGGWHHMGTTRMDMDPKQGVVDERGRVHDVDNLYVAGSSVFPTVGYANPMLTVVALALRLADQLKRTIDAPPATVRSSGDPGAARRDRRSAT